MNLPHSVFREYDIRGIAGKDISSEFAKILGLAYAKILGSRRPAAGKARLTVSVGRDCRITGKEYSESLISGLSAGGLDIVDLGVCATPLTYFSLFHLDLDGAIMVTGSHNPSEYNGFKICIGRDTLHGAQIQEIRTVMSSMASSSSSPQALGKISHYPIIPAYIDHLVKHARKPSKKKIVLDAGNGTAGNIAPELFRRLGAEVVELYCELDGTFPNHHPDPTVPKNLADLIATVKKEEADFGIAFDGDSDRIGLVDETGRIIFGDELMVIFSRAVLRENPGAAIISEVKSSHRLYQDIAKNGGRPVMWKTGHSLIKSKMKSEKALLAGEMSGHIFFADRYFGFDDAIYAALRVFEIASEHDGPLSSLISDLPKMVATPEIRIDCEEDLKFKLVEEAKRILAPGNRVTDIDGVRIDFKDGWGLARASNTQPVLVLRFEAENQSRLNQIRKQVIDAVSQAARAIGHPEIRFE